MNIKTCECGCGKIVKTSGCKFVVGHHRIGKCHTEDTKRKIRKGNVGKIRTQKQCENISRSLSGRRLSEEHRKNLSKKRKHCSEETKEKIRRAQIGVKRKPLSEEHKRKIGISLKGKVYLPWTRKARENHFNAVKRGENHPFWKGGISKEPYPFDFDEELKESIRKRDEHICQLCGRTQEENKRKLSVHHIDYMKRNITFENLISLCVKCNSKVNGNRSFWKEFFQFKLRLHKVS